MARRLFCLLPVVLAAACWSSAPEDPAPGEAAAPADVAVVPVAAATAVAGDDAAMDDHCAKMAHSSPFDKTQASYDLPDIELVDQAGARFAISDLADSEAPVAVNFIFATCTTICPVMTATFAQMRDQLGEDAERIKMVSITIDPEHDTPRVLADYAAKHDAPADWAFLTGPGGDVTQVLKAFDAWTGSKFGHEPITLLHEPGAETWVRLEGMGSGTALAEEVRALLPTPVIQ